MASGCENELELKPENIVEVGDATSSNLLPETSKKKYNSAYQLFMEWRKAHKTTSCSENVMLAYFSQLSEKYKSSTLWTQYSMLRTTLNIHHNVDIAEYLKLRMFLKRKSCGYRPTKTKTFSTEEINKFINEAPDQQYLLTKTALIMGVMGACRRHELHQMKTNHLTDLGSSVLVTVPDTKIKTVRTFTVSNYFYEIIKKYWNLRPPNANDPSFFLNYQKGKCTVQKVGINKFGAMGKQIATYLELPDPELYTGHCFRRSSATNLGDFGKNGRSLKRDGSWKSTVAENYNKIPTSNPVTSKSQENLICEKKPFLMMNFNNCTNVTFNININN